MKNMLPKGFSTFLKNPDMPKLACVVIAIFLAVLILRYFKVIEGMANQVMGGGGLGGGLGGGGGGGGGRVDSDSDPKNPQVGMKSMMDPSQLMAKIGMK